MTMFETIKQMSIEEMANFFANTDNPILNIPNSPCYLCEFDHGITCLNPLPCTSEYKARLYRDWLEKEITINENKRYNI